MAVPDDITALVQRFAANEAFYTVKFVERMLALHQDLSAAKTAHEKTALQREIDATDREIDALVYELYGLTADEIKLVEESAGA